LNIVPGQPIYLYGAQCNAAFQGSSAYSQQFGAALSATQGCPGGKAINPDAFAPAFQRDASGNPVFDSNGNPIPVQGNAPRNFARLFGAWQMNVGIRREFPVYERMKVQFRAEAFNIFNHPNFGLVSEYWGLDPTFGLGTKTLASSNNVESSLYALGGPRSMQFALKLVF
jgi:hypothetical protein